jgi:uncharacterized protein (TIGR03790 family)
VVLPSTGITADELAVLVNDDDPQSVAVANAYVAARQIPEANLVHVVLPVKGVVSKEEFASVEAKLAELDDSIQALAITWTWPYRVECMSVTSAATFGYDDEYCNTSGESCSTTAASPYFDSDSTDPFSDHGIRPAMMLAATEVANATDLIDRGIAADATFPVGDIHMIRTTDVARSVRWPQFTELATVWNHADGLKATYVDNSEGDGLNYISETRNVLVYLTGLTTVPSLETNTYLPGAVADHLTSSGGQVPDSGQMSILRWLEAGATASYGTVVEPCNYVQKFPDANVLVSQYFRGATVMEAYWKSVAWPGEGLFIGEPLARPWGTQVEYGGTTLEITTTTLAPDVDYEVQSAEAADGPWSTVTTVSVSKPQFFDIVIEDATAPFYRLEASAAAM